MSPFRKKPAVVASQGVTLRDFVVFQLKLALDGVKDLLAINLSILAIVVDLVAGRGRRPRRFYAVVRMSSRFDDWLRLHSMKAIDEADAGADSPATTDVPERMLGSDADTLVVRFEELMQEATSERRRAVKRGKRT